ncbi:hypothetical protein AALP_AA8G507600 [Arabis alpina]|uniref:Uncharacterized protein n=1 Tax=Arabis alpina TaxID=50452 RepID=A0A087GES8_ARAAL|nr:hypothetical protein AALP_AA8G507600 [Arabis alpina]
MDPKTLAITPPLLLLSSFFFHLRGAAFGSSKAFHCLLLLSCLLLSSVNTLHNLAEYDSFRGSNGYNIAKGFHGGDSESLVPIQNVCPSSHLFSFHSALGLENQFDDGLSCPNKSWNSPVLMSNNNLSGVVWLSLRPVHIIEFQPELLSPFDIGDTTCYKPLSKELYGKKDTGEFSLLVSGRNGFMVHHQCEGFVFEPGESIKFLFYYQTVLDLELSWSSGIAVLAVPMKATAPVLMLNLGKKTVFWVRTKKFAIAVLIAAALLILIFCFNDHFVEEDNKRNNCSSHIAVRKVEKPSTITISPEMNSILRSISNDTLQGFVNNGSKDEDSKNSVKPVGSVSSSSKVEASEAVNLSVKTAKDKKRRRNKKKKKGAISDLTSERTDVSSSHSGTSTPSSPMSPEPPTNQATTKSVKPPKPVLSHSATFPVSGVKSMIIERSSLAPNVRAPGSSKSRTEVKEEKAKEHSYDIWGDHFTELNLMDSFKEVREGKSSSGFGEDESESFFVKGPQNLLADSHARFVSFCNQWG